MEPITLEITILKPISQVWEFFTEPSHITEWNFADESWVCPSAENDLRVGGQFNYRMEQRDGEFGFEIDLQDRFDLCSHCGQLLDFGARLSQEDA